MWLRSGPVSAGRGGRDHLRRAVVLVAVLVAVAAVGSPVASGARRAGAAIDECDWPAWGHGVDRSFSYPCETEISPQTAGDLRRIWFFNAKDTVTATPAVVDGTVFVGDWSGNFYALRLANGKPRWTRKIEPHGQVYAGQIVSSAAVAEVDGVRTVYFGGGKTLYALRARDGKTRWAFETGRPGDRDDPTEIESSPVIVDGLVLFGTDVHNSRSGEPAGVYALDAASGEQRWFAQLAPAEGADPTGAGCGDVWGSPTVDVESRTVFVGTGNCVTSPEGWGPNAEAIVALDLDTGAVRWTYQPHPPNNDDFDFAGAPNLFEIAGRKVVGLGNKDAAYYTVDRATGAEVWKTQATEPGIDERGSNYSYGGFIGPTAYADGIIVGGTAVGGSPALHAFDAATGALAWQQPVAGPTYAAAAEANGVVFIGGTDFTFRALDLRTGEVLWEEPVSGAVSGGAAIVGDSVVAVAGIREPGTDQRSKTSGVYRFSLSGRPVPSTATTAPPDDSTGGPPLPAPTLCVESPCSVPFQLKQPPPGITPELTMSIRIQPWRVEVDTEGLGPPEGWLRPGSSASQKGATRYGVFASERDDDPTGGLICILDDDGDCVGKKIPRVGATYNRISLLAITDSNELPTPAEGFDRLVTTQAFTPPLAPRR